MISPRDISISCSYTKRPTIIFSSYNLKIGRCNFTIFSSPQSVISGSIKLQVGLSLKINNTLTLRTSINYICSTVYRSNIDANKNRLFFFYCFIKIRISACIYGGRTNYSQLIRISVNCYIRSSLYSN